MMLALGWRGGVWFFSKVYHKRKKRVGVWKYSVFRRTLFMNGPLNKWNQKRKATNIPIFYIQKEALKTIQPLVSYSSSNCSHVGMTQMKWFVHILLLVLARWFTEGDQFFKWVQYSAKKQLHFYRKQPFPVSDFSLIDTQQKITSSKIVFKRFETHYPSNIWKNRGFYRWEDDKLMYGNGEILEYNEVDSSLKKNSNG